MKRGHVKWYNDARGYGMIEPDADEAIVFVHFTEILDADYPTLEAGEEVVFEVDDAEENHLRARNVHRCAPGGFVPRPFG